MKHLKVKILLILIVLDNFILADELFAKTLRPLKDCLSVNNNLCGKLFSSLESPVTFDERFKVNSLSFFLFLILVFCVVN